VVTANVDRRLESLDPAGPVPLGSDQAQVELDRINRENLAALEVFLAVCSIAFSFTGFGGIASRGTASFGRALATRFPTTATRLTTRFPSLTPHLALPTLDTAATGFAPEVAALAPDLATDPRFVVSGEGLVTDLGPRVSTASPVVIGESMEVRVIPAARRLGVGWYDQAPLPNVAQSQAHDRYWMNEMMNQGRLVVDIGPAAGRPAYPEPTSPWFVLERSEIMRRDYRYYVQFPWDW
jgi:hypothetical protein